MTPFLKRDGVLFYKMRTPRAEETSDYLLKLLAYSTVSMFERLKYDKKMEKMEGDWRFKRLSSKKLLFVMSVGLFVFWASEVLCAEVISHRDSQVEAFLSEGKGWWVSTQPINGKELLFLFTKAGQYCGGETQDWRRSCGQYWVYSREDGGYYLQLKEESGKLIKMILEIKESYLIRINGRELKRQSPQ